MTGGLLDSFTPPGAPATGSLLAPRTCYCVETHNPSARRTVVHSYLEFLELCPDASEVECEDVRNYFELREGVLEIVPVLRP